MELKCIQKVDGFTVGEKYKLLGCAGEYIQLKDDNNEISILYEGYFEIVK